MPREAREGRQAGLEIDEDLPMQRQIWRFERVGWAALTLFVLAGLLGTFGGGTLSQAELSDASRRLTVRFERFARADAPTKVEIRMVAAQQSPVLWIDLSKDYFDASSIDSIVPEPELTVVTGNTIRFGFDPHKTGYGGMILITLKPAQIGRVRGSLGVVGGPTLKFTQIIYP